MSGVVLNEGRWGAFIDAELKEQADWGQKAKYEKPEARANFSFLRNRQWLIGVMRDAFDGGQLRWATINPRRVRLEGVLRMLESDWAVTWALQADTNALGVRDLIV